MKKRAIIMGAAGRDFHNFNVFFRDNPEYDVVCFTANQIPNIDKRTYPKELSGRLYKNGIPIHPESELVGLIKRHKADCVFLAYSDLSNEDVMKKASTVIAAGADFILMGNNSTMIKSRKPVISICAVRTGAGKSPATRKISEILRSFGVRPVVVRHPMPYGNLAEEAVQRFEKIEDLDRNKCTIEEIEDYEHHLREGVVVYAGVDYERILRQAEKEADIILWDGGNNDTPFFVPDLHIVIADAHRPNHEKEYYPGEANVMMADIVIINKVVTAGKRNTKIVEDNIRELNPDAIIIKAKSKITTTNPELIRGKSVLLVDDGPTITHGGMKYGVGKIIAKRYHARRIINPRPYAVGEIKKTLQKYPHITDTLPAIGYNKKQVHDLEKTINRAKCDSVIAGTPIILKKHLKINKPVARVSYSMEETVGPDIVKIIRDFVRKKKAS